MGEHWPALTVRQPWAWAWLHGKPVENRGWEMKYRGPLWLHAGSRARWDPAGADSPLVRRAWADYARSRPEASNTIWLLRRSTSWMPFGAVTALVDVTGCHHADECMLPARLVVPPGGSTGCSPWAIRGQWHIELDSVQPLPEPVPCRGMLKLWPLPEDIESAVRAQLEATRA